MSAQVKVPPQKAAVGQACCGSVESASSGSDVWRITPPTRKLIRNDDAARLIRLGNSAGPSGERIGGNAVQYASQHAASTAR